MKFCLMLVLIFGSGVVVLGYPTNCPPDFTPVGDHCEKRIILDSSCPPGLTLENGMCHRREQITPNCPPGYSMVNNRCVLKRVVLPQCPDGFTFDTYERMCRRSSSTCPIGQKMENGVCSWPEQV